MNILSLIILWLLAWVSIIILSALTTKLYYNDILKYGEEYIELTPYQKCKDEMLSDGNNLFSTGFLYIITLIVCYYIGSNIISYIAIVATVIFCIPSIISLVLMLPQLFIVRNKYITIMTFSGAIHSIVPLIIAINSYFLLIV